MLHTIILLLQFFTTQVFNISLTDNCVIHENITTSPTTNYYSIKSPVSIKIASNNIENEIEVKIINSGENEISFFSFNDYEKITSLSIKKNIGNLWNEKLPNENIDCSKKKKYSIIHSKFSNENLITLNFFNEKRLAPNEEIKFNITKCEPGTYKLLLNFTRQKSNDESTWGSSRIKQCYSNELVISE